MDAEKDDGAEQTQALDALLLAPVVSEAAAPDLVRDRAAARDGAAGGARGLARRRRGRRRATAGSCSSTRSPRSCSVTRARAARAARPDAVARARARSLHPQHGAVFRHRASAAVLHRGLGAAARRLGVRRRDELGDRRDQRGPAAARDRARHLRAARRPPPRLRAVAAMGGRALAGADLADLAGEAVERLRSSLPVARRRGRDSRGGVAARVVRTGCPRRGSGLRSAPAMSCSSRPRAALDRRGAELRARGREHARDRARPGSATRSGCATRRCTTR